MHKLGIIGFGGMASYHFDTLKEAGYNRLEIKGVFDLNKERLKFAEEKGLIAYSSKEALLNDSEIDIVLIATSNEVHKDLSIEAMKCGKHVICEKPVTLSSEELEEIMEASEKYKKVFTIDQNRRTNRDFVLMKRKVEEGVLGKVYHIESRVKAQEAFQEAGAQKKSLAAE